MKISVYPPIFCGETSARASLFRRFTDTEPFTLKCGQLATKYPWICGYFYSVARCIVSSLSQLLRRVSCNIAHRPTSSSPTCNDPISFRRYIYIKPFTRTAVLTDVTTPFVELLTEFCGDERTLLYWPTARSKSANVALEPI